MPCFFFISGWLLNDKYLTDLKTGVFRRLKSSYYPFVKWTLIFLLLHNVFTSWHIYETNYSLREFGIKAIRILTMTGGEQLLGGYWFLISLCWASLASLLLFSAFKKYNLLNISVKWGGVIVVLLIAVSESYLTIKIPAQFGTQTVLATAFYMSGYLCRKMNLYPSKYPLALGTSFFLMPAIVSMFVEWGMVEGCDGWKVFPYYIIAILGTMGVIGISKWLVKRPLISDILAYVGNKTLYILTFHFLAFKLVSYLYIRHNGLSMNLLASSPVIKDSPSYLWIIYTVVGVSLPLFVWELFHLKSFYITICKQLQSVK